MTMPFDAHAKLSQVIPVNLQEGGQTQTPTTEVNRSSPAERMHLCPCCSSAALRQLATPGRWIGEEVFGAVRHGLGLSQCPRCGLAFVNPRPSPELLNQFYSEANYRRDRARDQAPTQDRAAFILDQIKRYAPSRVRVLDIGARGGDLLRNALARGWDAVEYAVGRQGLHVFRAHGLPVRDEFEMLPVRSFDAIVLRNLLERQPDPAATLARLRRLLSAAGKLFIEVPNAQSLRARLSFPVLSRYAHVEERYHAFPVQLFYFGPKSLRILLERADLRVEALESSGFGLGRVMPRKPCDAADGAPNSLMGMVRNAKHDCSRLFEGPLRRAVHGRMLGESLLVVASTCRQTE